MLQALKRLEFVVSRAGIQVNKSIGFGLYSKPSSLRTSNLLGVPIKGSLTFPFDSYFDLDGREVSFSRLEIDTVILIVSQTKNIVTTSIQGQAGTIKEYVSDGDYNIRISGGLFGDSYPEEDFNNLLKILKAPIALNVKSDYLELFGIDKIVITDYSTPQERGLENAQYFEINALSDEEIEL